MSLNKLSGVERNHSGNPLIPVGGKLPYYLEMRTSILLDCFQSLSPKAAGKKNRQRLNQALAARTRLGMYLELNQSLHLAYADQRDGRGSQHWWRLFFDESMQASIEQASGMTAREISTQQPTEEARHSRQGLPRLAWSGMYFRSQAELRIAQALQERGVLFFANSQGMASLEGLPITIDKHGLVERLEADFLVFREGHCLCLEVDGKHHAHLEIAEQDAAKERVLLRERIATVRFPAQDCLTRPDDVVTEFLSLFPGRQ